MFNKILLNNNKMDKDKSSDYYWNRMKSLEKEILYIKNTMSIYPYDWEKSKEMNQLSLELKRVTAKWRKKYREERIKEFNK